MPLKEIKVVKEEIEGDEKKKKWEIGVKISHRD
jgi:hypothetical protein